MLFGRLARLLPSSYLALPLYLTMGQKQWRSCGSPSGTWRVGGSLVSWLGRFAWLPTPETERPIPILTGNAGFFTHIEGGKADLVPEINPVILLPLGDRWLVETRGEFKGEFQRPQGGGPYGGE